MSSNFVGYSYLTPSTLQKETQDEDFRKKLLAISEKKIPDKKLQVATKRKIIHVTLGNDIYPASTEEVKELEFQLKEVVKNKGNNTLLSNHAVNFHTIELPLDRNSPDFPLVQISSGNDRIPTTSEELAWLEKSWSKVFYSDEPVEFFVTFHNVRINIININ